jgi:hypothetical protein
MRRLFGEAIVLAVMVLLAVLPVSAATINATRIYPGAMVFVGESGLDITNAMQAPGTASMIAWFPSTAQQTATVPEKVIDVSANNRSFYVNPADFATRTGNWYCWSFGQIVGDSAVAFIVMDPQIDVKVWDLNQNKDVSGKSAPVGERLTFRVDTNGYAIANPAMRSSILQPSWNSVSNGSYYGFDPATGAPLPKTPEGFIDIKVKTAQGNTLFALYSASVTDASSKAIPLIGMWVNSAPWFWGNATFGYYWNTSSLDEIGQKVYPAGTYIVYAEFNINSMKDNYKNAGADYTGKTVSEARTITLVPDTVKIEANRDSVTRSMPFSVTVTGRPGSYYWIWVRGTSGMSGGYDDQPPMIPPYQAGVFTDGSTTTGIPRDIANTTYGAYLPEDKNAPNYVFAQVPDYPFNGARYWAMVRTNDNGVRTVEFATSNQTRAQKYTIRVENNTNPATTATGSSVGGDFKTDEVDVTVDKGLVTIVAAGAPIYYMNDTIQFSGSNTGSTNVYLYMTGQGFPPEGAQMLCGNPKYCPVVNGVPPCFIRPPVLSDNSWSWSWQTGSVSLDPGTYTIVAETDPVDAQHLANASGYASVDIILTNQSVTNFILLSPGWNFVSAPKKLSNGNDTAAIFSSVDTAAHSIYLYNASEQRWHAMTVDEKVQPLDGIWIYSNTTAFANLIFDANPMQTPPAKTLSAGWNAIGFSDTSPVSARNTLISVQNKWTTLIGFDPLQQRYESSIITGAADPTHGDQRVMYPQKGYWLYMTQAGELAAISA